MAESSLANAFNDCIDRLQTGQTLDDCLRAYPQYARDLRPMLELGLTIRRVSPPVPAVARARVRARVMDSADRIRPPRRFGWQRVPLAAAAAVALVITAGSLMLWWNRDDDVTLHTEPLASPSAATSSTETAIPATTPFFTSTPSPSATLSATPSATMTRTPVPSSTPRPTGISESCRFQVTASSINLRTGPGPGYDSLGYGFTGDEYPVLAAIPDQTWLNVTSSLGNVWVTASAGTLSGDCADLPASDDPFQGTDGGDITFGDKIEPDAEVSSDTATNPPAPSGSDQAGSGGDDNSGDHSDDDQDDDHSDDNSDDGDSHDEDKQENDD